MIKREFGVSYHADHIGRLLRAIGWSVQKPIERATERNDAAIERWRSEKWPAIKKKPNTRSRTLVWIDEAGFYLLPALVRTWAPVGEPPILHAPCSYDHLSAISAITPNGQLLLHVQEEAYHGDDVVRFLKHVLRHIPGQIADPVGWSLDPSLASDQGFSGRWCSTNASISNACPGMLPISIRMKGSGAI